MEFKCDICNIQYKTNSGLWKHNVKNHIKSSIDNKQLGNNIVQLSTVKDDGNKKNYFCRKCNKQLSDRNSRWRHEKTCNKVSIDTINEKVKYF